MEKAVANIGYYVSSFYGSKGPFLFFGPLDTKEAAEAKVDAVSKRAEELDPRAAFAAFGVTKVTSPNALKPGKMNDYMEAN